MGGASIWHWIVVGVLIMIFFGRGKISEMMGDMAKGIKAFKKGMAEDDTAVVTTPAPGHPAVTETVRTIEHRNVDTTAPAATVSTLADRKIG